MKQDKNPEVKTEENETEEFLINTAQTAVSECRWVVGECAAKWTQKYARGRTDADFGELISLSGDQVFQRRRVWETFADVRNNYPALKWSHFYAAINWDDAAECFQWAEETFATVAEMRAWRRALHGEDLTAPGEGDTDAIAFVPSELTPVQDPDDFSGQPRGNSPGERNEENSSRQSAVARQTEGGEGEYVPFRQGAMTPSSKEHGSSEEQGGNVAVAEAPPAIPASQVVKRATKALQRYEAAITPEFAKAFRTLPEQTQNRFIKAVGDLSSKVAELL